jgi:hypothetical protein
MIGMSKPGPCGAPGFTFGGTTIVLVRGCSIVG